jgi:16S rRNA processing protein RimM
MTDADRARLLNAGRVGSAHGLDGSFHVTRPTPELLKHGGKVTIAGSEHKIERRAGHDGHLIIRVSGCATRESADTLRGENISVPQSAAPRLGTDEWWAHDLEGCAVVDGEQQVGTVKALLGLPSCEVLEVTRASGGQDLLVPLVSDAVRTIDVKLKRIDIDLRFLGETGEDEESDEADGADAVPES